MPLCRQRSVIWASGISICATVILPNYGSQSSRLLPLCNYVSLVDLVRFELTTSSMPWKRAPNCATGPRGGTSPIYQFVRLPCLSDPRSGPSDPARIHQVRQLAASRAGGGGLRGGGRTEVWGR